MEGWKDGWKIIDMGMIRREERRGKALERRRPRYLEWRGKMEGGDERKKPEENTS